MDITITVQHVDIETHPGVKLVTCIYESDSDNERYSIPFDPSTSDEDIEAAFVSYRPIVDDLFVARAAIVDSSGMVGQQLGAQEVVPDPEPQPDPGMPDGEV